MLLEINKSTTGDQGVYRCEITFANRTLQNSAKLTVRSAVAIVIPSVNKDINKKITTPNKQQNDNTNRNSINKRVETFTVTNSNNNNGKTNSEKPITNGQCSTYDGNVCKAYLGSTVIFERTPLQPMSLLNEQLDNVFRIIKGYRKLSKKLVCLFIYSCFSYKEIQFWKQVPYCVTASISVIFVYSNIPYNDRLNMIFPYDIFIFL